MSADAGGYRYPYAAPGIIPLRPLNLSEIFNGAFAYIRANPKTTLGVATVVVVIAQLLAMLLQFGPLATGGALAPPDLTGPDPDITVLMGSVAGSMAGAVAIWLSSILLSGLLTVIVGRAVFGSAITIGEAWQRVRGRLLALLAYAALETLGAALVVAAVAGVITMVAFVLNGWAAFALGVPLVFAAVVALVYLFTKLSFAPTLIVLERLPVVAAIERSFALVRRDFWRVFGIRVLAMLVAALISTAVGMPFSIGSQVLILMGDSAGTALAGMALASVGAAIGQIVTAPFTAGVVVLLYTDRRIRAEAFDLVLHTGAGGGPADSTDHLWLTRRP
ncbi:MAG TPA: hypothetical protein VJY85_07770 [Candidatus Limnocylindria bacterium]|nr:hypothetical protein [Candidatus Limnocylindria bacterium]